MRESCTTLTTECLSGTATSMTDFDSRALTIFGVTADTATNKMCGDIKAACTNLMAATGGGADWTRGITDIASQKTYAQIISTCAQVGQNCITQNCTTYVSNFGNCMKPDDPERNNIMNRKICWSEVYNCVMGPAGVATDPQTLVGIIKNNPADFELADGAFDLCNPKTTGAGLDPNGCKITQRIWGNCDNDPQSNVAGQSAKIMPNANYTTLLAWLDDNTPTAAHSCQGQPCPAGQVHISGTELCGDPNSITSDGSYCDGLWFYVIGDPGTTPSWTNCCSSGKTDSFGNCCNTGTSVQNVSVDITGKSTAVTPDGGKFSATPVASGTGTYKICASGTVTYIARYNTGHGTEFLFCNGTVTIADATSGTPQNAKCNGKLFVVDASTGLYSMPTSGYTLSGGAGIDFGITHNTTTDGLPKSSTNSSLACPIKFTNNNGWSYVSPAAKPPCQVTLPQMARWFINAGQ